MKELDNPFVGEMVYWHKTGVRENHPRVVVVTQYNRRFDDMPGMVDIAKAAASYGETANQSGIPHIDDPRLKNPEFARETGGWELTPYGKFVRGLHERLLAVEHLNSKPASAPPKAKPKAAAEVSAMVEEVKEAFV